MFRLPPRCEHLQHAPPGTAEQDDPVNVQSQLEVAGQFKSVGPRNPLRPGHLAAGPPCRYRITGLPMRCPRMGVHCSTPPRVTDSNTWMPGGESIRNWRATWCVRTRTYPIVTPAKPGAQPAPRSTPVVSAPPPVAPCPRLLADDSALLIPGDLTAARTALPLSEPVGGRPGASRANVKPASAVSQCLPP